MKNPTIPTITAISRFAAAIPCPSPSSKASGRRSRNAVARSAPTANETRWVENFRIKSGFTKRKAPPISDKIPEIKQPIIIQIK